ncbi:MAG: hypothetical protein ACPGEG_10500 [Salibacteraceae bacterium]
MIRNLFVFLNILPFIFLFNSTEIAKEKLQVELTAPANVKPNSSFDVQIKITGGQVSGFAKYVDVLPEGFTAEQLEIGDATFTADNGQVKILWVSFPKEDVTLTFRITANENAPASLTLGGKFSYLENNEKKTYSIFKKTINVGEEILAEESTEQSKGVVGAVVERRILKSRDNIHEIELTIKQSGIEGFAKIQEFVPFGATIEKGETQNAAYSYVKNKVKFVWMSIPADETFKISYYVDLSNADSKDIKSIEGDFSYLENDASKKIDVQFIDGETKVLASAQSNSSNEEDTNVESETKTESKPAVSDDALAVVTAKTEISSGSVEKEEQEDEKEIEEENKTTLDQRETESLEDESDNGTNNTAENTAVELENEDSEVATEESEKIVDPTLEESVLASEDLEEQTPEIIEEEIEVITQEEVVAAKETDAISDESKTQTIASTNTGVMYKVQIAAGHKVVNAEYFKKRHEFESDFSIENHEGWVKYTTGSYNSYKLARDSRVSINEAGHKFNGPFVTAYNQGERITVQEALMISNQKWFK